MESLELFDYVSNVSDYVEYSFYTNSPEIMDAISRKGFENVLTILASDETRKGIYQCRTSWEVSDSVSFKKDIVIDISGEVIFITEVINSADSPKEVDVQKEYGEVLKLLSKKVLSENEKKILLKIVKAFFEE